MTSKYLTISHSSTGLYKDKGSRFLSFAECVTSEEEAKSRLEYYRKRYHDARHVCYAWVCGAEGEQSRSSDDGEPSGTAGRPILTQIQSRQLTYTLVVVVRYFGGVLLGTGGLVVAYRTAAAEALNEAGTEEKAVTVRKTIESGYAELDNVMRIIKSTDTRILSQTWTGDKCIIECEINKEHEHRL
ncbi:MAG: YigZ family protein [Paludibacteraceae bacterium]|nr:YigZ family protein [Paludibacteraceae bacterium]